ncbi:MAG: HNH endonuclease [Oxalobacteraceae bacterium]|nr:MAG: HNH endonuclease [Oxalobacteraceae bacterium]
MAKLKTLPSRLGSLSPMRGHLPAPERKPEAERKMFSPWRAWYNTTRWRRLRWAQLVKDHFTCTRCGKLKGDTAKLVCDHVTPHRGSAELFWDEGNLTTLCKPCHDSAKQREEQAEGMRGA